MYIISSMAISYTAAEVETMLPPVSANIRTASGVGHRDPACSHMRDVVGRVSTCSIRSHMSFELHCLRVKLLSPILPALEILHE